MIKEKTKQNDRRNQQSQKRKMEQRMEKWSLEVEKRSEVRRELKGWWEVGRRWKSGELDEISMKKQTSEGNVRNERDEK